jgi:hypothetical protein
VPVDPAAAPGAALSRATTALAHLVLLAAGTAVAAVRVDDALHRGTGSPAGGPGQAAWWFAGAVLLALLIVLVPAVTLLLALGGRWSVPSPVIRSTVAVGTVLGLAIASLVLLDVLASWADRPRTVAGVLRADLLAPTAVPVVLTVLGATTLRARARAGPAEPFLTRWRRQLVVGGGTAAAACLVVAALAVTTPG